MAENTMVKTKTTKEQTVTYNTLQTKLKIEQRETFRE
jgi:hypothetical protein